MKKPKKILLIDDDEIFLTIATKILEPEYKIIVTTSCNGALKKIVSGVIPDLILLDIIMPEMDGWDTYRILKGISILHEVPIVFLTSLNSVLDRQRANEIGATGYITKPIEREYLLKRIEGIFIEKDKKNEQ